MRKIEAMRAITKAYNILRSIDDDKALRKNHLTLTDYQAAKDIFSELSTPGTKAYTFMDNVAKFYKAAGFNVALKGVNYQIDTMEG